MTDKELTQRLIEAALIEDVAYPAGLEERLAASLRAKSTKTTPAAPKTIPTAHRTLSVVRWASAAAIALLIVSTAIGLLTPGLFSPTQPTFANTCSSPDEARAELQSALAMLQPTTNNGDLLNLLN